MNPSLNLKDFNQKYCSLGPVPYPSVTDWDEIAVPEHRPEPKFAAEFTPGSVDWLYQGVQEGF